MTKNSRGEQRMEDAIEKLGQAYHELQKDKLQLTAVERRGWRDLSSMQTDIVQAGLDVYIQDITASLSHRLIDSGLCVTDALLAMKSQKIAVDLAERPNTGLLGDATLIQNVALLYRALKAPELAHTVAHLLPSVKDMLTIQTAKLADSLGYKPVAPQTFEETLAQAQQNVDRGGFGLLK